MIFSLQTVRAWKSGLNNPRCISWIHECFKPRKEFEKRLFLNALVLIVQPSICIIIEMCTKKGLQMVHKELTKFQDNI